MSAFLGFAWLLFLLAAGTWLLSSALVPLLVRLALPVSLTPGARAQRLWLIAALPLLLPFTVVSAAFFLGLAKKLDWIHDHCVHHGIGHPHLCFEHLPQLFLDYPQALVAGGFASVLLLLSGRFAIQQWRQALRLDSLKAFARGSGRLRLIDDARVLAFAAGLRRPQVFMSRGLLHALNRRERRIVLAHEAAHLRHGDLTKTFVFELLLLLHFPLADQALRRSWRQVMEERADDRVVNRFGTTAVASALLAVSKAAMQPAGALSVAGADPLQRVQRLLASPAERKQSGVFAWGYGAAVLAAGVATVVAHHDLETLLGILV